METQEDKMRTAGGTIALIAGVFGIFAAIVTLSVGSIGSAVSAKDAALVVYLGYGGLACSFLTIVFGAIAIGVTSKIPGRMLMVCAAAGAIFGGTFVAVFMILAFIGGILVLVGNRRIAIA